MKQIALICLGLFGCSAAGEGPSVVIPPLTLSPEGIDYALVQDAAERWEQATGLPLLVQAGGAPVRYAPMSYDKNSGETAVHWRSDGPTEILWVHIDERRAHNQSLVGHILLHETGHAVCEHGILGQTEDNCHSGSGLLHRTVVGEPCIDAASLATVCGYRDCQTFSPEC